MVAVGTGYGRLSMTEFGQGLATASRSDFAGIERATVVVRSENEADEIRHALGQTSAA